MRFLLDQDVYRGTALFLTRLGHEVCLAGEIGLSRSEDSELLARAAQDHRLLVTRDKDFGSLVFVEHLGAGVILLRVTPATVEPVHRQLELLLRAHSEAELSTAFVTVEPGGCRLRKLV